MRLQTLYEAIESYKATQLVARKYPHPVLPGRTLPGTWMVMLGDLHIANIKRITKNWVPPKWDWHFICDLPKYIYCPAMRQALTRLTRQIEYAKSKSPSRIFTVDIYEELNKVQLDNVIKAIKLRLKELPFGIAVSDEMRRHGYGNDKSIFKQIGDGMRRRSANKRRAIGKRSERLSRSPSEYRSDVKRAAAKARRDFEQALIRSPNIDDIDKSDYISAAASDFNVGYEDVAAAV